jgi:hypothetical protein
MPRLMDHVTDDDAAALCQMTGGFAEHTDPPAGFGDEAVTAVRKNNHVERLRHFDIFKKPFDDVGREASIFEVPPGRRSGAARGLDTGHLVPPCDERNQIAAGSGSHEKHRGLQGEKPGHEVLFPWHQPRGDSLVRSLVTLPHVPDSRPNVVNAECSCGEVVEYSVRPREEPSDAE